MFALDTYGLLGALVMLVIGAIDYVVIKKVAYGRIVERYRRAQRDGESSIHPETVMNLVMVVSLIVFPLIGYGFGSKLASGFGGG